MADLEARIKAIKKLATDKNNEIIKETVLKESIEKSISEEREELAKRGYIIKTAQEAKQLRDKLLADVENTVAALERSLGIGITEVPANDSSENKAEDLDIFQPSAQ